MNGMNAVLNARKGETVTVHLFGDDFLTGRIVDVGDGIAEIQDVAEYPEDALYISVAAIQYVLCDREDTEQEGARIGCEVTKDKSRRK